MPFPPFKKILPGQRQLSARDLNKAQRGVENSSRIAGAGDVTLSSSTGGIAVANLSPPSVEIQITGAPTGASYPWVEVAAGVTPCPGSRGGTATVNPARETSGNTGVPVGTITRAFLSPDQTGYLFSFGGSGTSFSGAQCTTAGAGGCTLSTLYAVVNFGTSTYDTDGYRLHDLNGFQVPFTGYYGGIFYFDFATISNPNFVYVFIQNSVSGFVFAADEFMFNATGSGGTHTISYEGHLMANEVVRAQAKIAVGSSVLFVDNATIHLKGKG